MATKKAATKSTTTRKAQYVTHTAPTVISATSRCAVKIRDNYYTIDAHEERTITEQEGLDLKAEWKMLFDELNSVVDNQIEEILDSTKK